MMADPIQDPTDVNLVRRSVANTYTAGFDAVQQYDRVMRYWGEHPDKGSQAVSTAVDLPRGRVRPWLNGSKPDPVRALDVLTTRKWDDLDWNTVPFTGLNVLVAWIFAGGSINENWVPRFAIGRDREKRVLDATFEAIGAEGESLREEDSDRAAEVRVTQDASVLGRLLAVLGAPVGSKHAEREIQLPPYLSAAPEETCLNFARTYVLCRGTNRPDRPTMPIQIIEERPSVFRNEVREMFESLGEADWIRGEDRTIYLRKPAVDLFDTEPTV